MINNLNLYASVEKWWNHHHHPHHLSGLSSWPILNPPYSLNNIRKDNYQWLLTYSSTECSCVTVVVKWIQAKFLKLYWWLRSNTDFVVDRLYKESVFSTSELVPNVTVLDVWTIQSFSTAVEVLYSSRIVHARMFRCDLDHAVSRLDNFTAATVRNTQKRCIAP